MQDRYCLSDDNRYEHGEELKRHEQLTLPDTGRCRKERYNLQKQKMNRISSGFCKKGN